MDHVRVDARGRIVIPAEARKRLGLREGSALVVRVVDAKLVLEPRSGVLHRMRERFADLPEGTSLSSELIADRRDSLRR